jgi:hypothetical protein
MKYKILFVSIFCKYSLFLNCTIVYVDEKHEKVIIADISSIKRTKNTSYYQIPPCHDYKAFYPLKNNINQSVQEEFKLYDSLLRFDFLKSIKNLQIDDKTCPIKHNSMFLKYCSFYMPSLKYIEIYSHNIPINLIESLKKLSCFPKTLTNITILTKNTIHLCDFKPEDTITFTEESNLDDLRLIFETLELYHILDKNKKKNK